MQTWRRKYCLKGSVQSTTPLREAQILLGQVPFDWSLVKRLGIIEIERKCSYHMYEYVIYSLLVKIAIKASYLACLFVRINVMIVN